MISRKLQKYLGNTKGALLIEVLVSILIFTIGMVAAFSLLMNAVRLNSLSKNRIIAVNLARESLEIVKNIRDTNWLVYSANIRECWNFSPDEEDDGDLDASDATCVPAGSGTNQNNHPIGTIDSSSLKRVRSFIVDFDPTNSRWMLLPASQYLDTISQTFINYDGTTLARSNGDLGIDSETGETIDPADFGDREPSLNISTDGRYTHDPNGVGTVSSPFLRTINVCYLDNIASGEDCSTSGLFPNDDPGNDPAEDNRIQLTAKVYWKEKSSDPDYKSVEIETILTDYLNRTNWLE